MDACSTMDLFYFLTCAIAAANCANISSTRQASSFVDLYTISGPHSVSYTKNHSSDVLGHVFSTDMTKHHLLTISASPLALLTTSESTPSLLETDSVGPSMYTSINISTLNTQISASFVSFETERKNRSDVTSSANDRTSISFQSEVRILQTEDPGGMFTHIAETSVHITESSTEMESTKTAGKVNNRTEVRPPPRPKMRPTIDPHLLHQQRMEPICWAVSLVFVFTSLLLLLILDLPRSTKFFCHRMLLASYSLGLAANFITSMDVQTRFERYSGWCTFHRLWYSYISLTLYSCMFVEGIHICLMLTTVFESRSKKWTHVIYFIIAWVLPGIIILIEFGAFFDNFKNDPRCQSLAERWIWKGPALAFLVANLLCFCYIVFIAISKILDSRKYSGTFEKALGAVRSMLVIFPLLGVTFIFAFFVQEGFVFGYVFIISYAGLGILFFVFHVVYDTQVLAALKKDVFGIRVQSSKTSQSTECQIQSTPQPFPKNSLPRQKELTTFSSCTENNNTGFQSLNVAENGTPRRKSYESSLASSSSDGKLSDFDYDVGMLNAAYDGTSMTPLSRATPNDVDYNTRF